MKKYIGLIALLIPFFTYAQPLNYIVKITAPTTYARKAFLTMSNLTDSAEAIKGTYTFKGITRIPGIATISIKGLITDFSVFIDTGTCSIDFTDFKNPRLSGNKSSTDYYYKLSLPVTGYNNVINDLLVKELRAKRSKSPDSVKLRKQINENVALCFGVPQTYIKNNPNSLVSITALEFMGVGQQGSPISLNQLESMFNSLSETVKLSDNGKNYVKKLRKWQQEDSN